MRADSAALGAAAELLREQGFEKMAITAEVLRNFVDMAEATLSPVKNAEGTLAMFERVPNVYNTLREADYSVAGSVALTGMTLAADVTGVTSLEEAWTGTRILTPDVPMSMADRITSGIMGSLQLAATGAGIYAGAGAAGGWIRGSGVGKLSTKGLAANLGDLADMQGGTAARVSAGPGRPGMGVVARKGMTPDQRALKDLVNEATQGGRKPLTVGQAEAILDWAQEVGYPGVRAKPGDVSVPSNWSGGGGQPHIHIPGVGSGHIPVQPGVKPR